MTTDEKLTDLKVFLTNAFCIDGRVDFVNENVTYDHYFELNDSKRGKFIISMKRFNMYIEKYINHLQDRRF